MFYEKVIKNGKVFPGLLGGKKDLIKTKLMVASNFSGATFYGRRQWSTT